jgi:hypothetical protein
MIGVFGNGVCLAEDSGQSKPISELFAYSAQAGSGMNGVFYVMPETFLSINEKTNLVITSDIILGSSVSGQGILLVKSDHIVTIDANSNSISRLKIQNPKGVALKSPLIIDHEIALEDGSLLLNDYDLVLANPFVEVNSGTNGQIACNGSGRIIFQSIQDFASTDKNTVQNNVKVPVSGIIADEIEEGFNASDLCFSIQINYTSRFIVPPTPPPD